MSAAAEDLVAGCDEIVSPPSVYLRLKQVIDHPHSSINDMAAVIHDDVGLTAKLLRIVNSAFFNLPNKIETVGRAITVVGTQQVVDLAMASAVTTSFKQDPKEFVDMNEFWRHSLAVGVVARTIAQELRVIGPERYFVAGLLHDIGRIVVYLQNAEQTREVFARCGKSHELMYKVEPEVMGYDHATVGSLLLKSWGLADLHVETVGCHHCPSEAKQFPVEAATIHVADLISTALEFGSTGERLVPELDPEAWERVGLAPEQLPGILEKSEQSVNEAAKVFLQES